MLTHFSRVPNDTMNTVILVKGVSLEVGRADYQRPCLSRFLLPASCLLR